MPLESIIQVRLMRPDDIEMGLELCRFAGWNQIRSHWEILLSLAPDGVFAAEVDGKVRATASAVNYGTRIAWIGMILVHPEYRRRGIAARLMTHCIEHLRGKGVESIKLDATDLGRPVYLRLGFQDERVICRYVAPKPARCVRGAARPICPQHWPEIAELDRMAFDADRLPLLKLLQAHGESSAVIERRGIIEAFGFARRGFHASSIGPVVASNPDAAHEVVQALFSLMPEGDVFWDLMPDNGACRTLAESLGFTVARRLTRMYLGAMNPGQVNMVFAGAGFELG